MTGWSAILFAHKAFGNWERKYQHVDIAKLESEATLLGLKSFGKKLAHHWVTVFIDNRVAWKPMDSGGKTPWQKEYMRKVLNFCDSADIWIYEFRWVPSAKNPADELTRHFDESDWSLKRDVFELLDHIWGPHTICPHSIDRMASESSTHLARFNSRWHCPTTEAVDCFKQDWEKEINYVCAPLGQLD